MAFRNVLLPNGAYTNQPLSGSRGRGNLPSELTGEPNFEREQWEADLRLREHEVAVNARKNEAKIVELRRSRWNPPIFYAV